MSDDSAREALSALADGELDRAQAARVLEAVSTDPALREQWRRHHLVSAVLSGQRGGFSGNDDLADRVRAALSAEPPRAGARGGARARVAWLPVALAASLAGAAIVAGIVVRGEREAPPANGPTPASITPTLARQGGSLPRSVRAVDAPPAPTRSRMIWNGARPAVEARLNGYLLTHNDYLAGGVRGMLPYARVVGYDGHP